MSWRPRRRVILRTMGKTMNKCLLAIGLLIGFNISAEAARTCSHAMFECKAANARLEKQPKRNATIISRYACGRVSIVRKSGRALASASSKRLITVIRADVQL